MVGMRYGPGRRVDSVQKGKEKRKQSRFSRSGFWDEAIFLLRFAFFFLFFCFCSLFPPHTCTYPQYSKNLGTYPRYTVWEGPGENSEFFFLIFCILKQILHTAPKNFFKKKKFPEGFSYGKPSQSRTFFGIWHLFYDPSRGLGGSSPEEKTRRFFFQFQRKGQSSVLKARFQEGSKLLFSYAMAMKRAPSTLAEEQLWCQSLFTRERLTSTLRRGWSSPLLCPLTTETSCLCWCRCPSRHRGRPLRVDRR